MNIIPNINWNDIDTVLLDMDGTLLDLYFDNYFWQEYLPEKWGSMNNISAKAAKEQLLEWYAEEAGTLSWYCLDFWTERLNFDVLKLKTDVEHLIQFRPHAESFLQRLNKAAYKLIMVTNAHENLIEMKAEVTRIDKYFERIISSHALGYAKEEQAFWHKLQQELAFEPKKTLLVDDNLTVLRAAKEFGISNLLTIAKPDSRNPEQETDEFIAIHSFHDLNF